MLTTRRAVWSRYLPTHLPTPSTYTSVFAYIVQHRGENTQGITLMNGWGADQKSFEEVKKASHHVEPNSDAVWVCQVLGSYIHQIRSETMTSDNLFFSPSFLPVYPVEIQIRSLPPSASPILTPFWRTFARLPWTLTSLFLPFSSHTSSYSNKLI